MSTVFNRVADDYDNFRPVYPDGVYDTLEAYAGSLAGRRVLDLAAGTGIASRGLRARGARVVAADLGADMLRILRDRSPDVPVVVASGNDLSFADATFDVITCACAWHWLDPARRAAEVTRLLRPGGTIALWWALGSLEGGDGANDRERAVYERWRVGQRELITPPPDTSEPAKDLPSRGFVNFEEHNVVATRDVTVEAHIRHVSTHSPVLALRDDLPAFQADLRAALDSVATVTEQVHCSVFLARTP